MINIEEIKKIFEVNEGEQKHKKYIFYYDETNNYQKVRIEDDGLNAKDAFENNYVLGGIVFLKEKEELVKESIDKLFKEKLIKYKNGELKSIKLFKKCNGFIQCLNKYQVNEILKWINYNGFIHYTSFNCLYFTIIDLVDSFFTDEFSELFPKEYIDIEKTQMFNLINYYFKEDFIEFANKINYPNIEGKDVKNLCDWIIEKIDYVHESDNFELELFRQIVKSKRNNKELIFLKNNEKNTIVENFYGLRQQKCIRFDESYHIFDNETNDRDLMRKNPLTKDGINPFINYEFKDSKESRLIQISDIIVSLIRRFFSYLDNTSVLKIKEDIKNLNKCASDNLELLIDVINISIKENMFFAEAIDSPENNYTRFQIIDYIDKCLKLRE